MAQQNPVLLTPGFRHHSLLRDWTCIKGANERIVLKEKYAPSKHGGGTQAPPSRKKKKWLKEEKKWILLLQNCQCALVKGRWLPDMENALKATCVQLLHLTHARFRVIWPRGREEIKTKKEKSGLSRTQREQETQPNYRQVGISSKSNRDQTGITVVKLTPVILTEAPSELSNETIHMMSAEIKSKGPLNGPHRAPVNQTDSGLLTTDYFVPLLNSVSPPLAFPPLDLPSQDPRFSFLIYSRMIFKWEGIHIRNTEQETCLN